MTTIPSRNRPSPPDAMSGGRQAYSRQAGVEHNVINDSDDEFVFVEIEIR